MIRVPEVRVINHDGEQLGVMPTRQAQELADELGYDLVEVSPTGHSKRGFGVQEMAKKPTPNKTRSSKSDHFFISLYYLNFSRRKFC